MKSQAVLFLSLLVCASAFGREFTDTKGRKLEGELIGVTSGQASIKRAADGKVFALPVAQFSDADQKFMAEFAGRNVHHDFDVKITKTKLGKTKSQQGVVTMESEEWAYKVSLNNKSSTDLDNLRVDYWLFRRDDDGKNKNAPRVQESGTTQVAAIRRSAVHEFQTKSFMLNKEQLRADFYFPDGERNTKKDAAGGIALRIFKGDKEVFKYATNEDLLALAQGKTATSSSALSE